MPDHRPRSRELKIDAQLQVYMGEHANAVVEFFERKIAEYETANPGKTRLETLKRLTDVRPFENDDRFYKTFYEQKKPAFLQSYETKANFLLNYKGDIDDKICLTTDAMRDYYFAGIEASTVWQEFWQKQKDIISKQDKKVESTPEQILNNIQTAIFFYIQAKYGESIRDDEKQRNAWAKPMALFVKILNEYGNADRGKNFIAEDKQKIYADIDNLKTWYTHANTLVEKNGDLNSIVDVGTVYGTYVKASERNYKYIGEETKLKQIWIQLRTLMERDLKKSLNDFTPEEQSKVRVVVENQDKMIPKVAIAILAYIQKTYPDSEKTPTILHFMKDLIAAAGKELKNKSSNSPEVYEQARQAEKSYAMLMKQQDAETKKEMKQAVKSMEKFGKFGKSGSNEGKAANEDITPSSSPDMSRK
jgi:hypothetical protein